MSTVTDMKTKRPYRMTTRAAAVQETRERILAAMFKLGTQRLFPEISLDDVAAEAGVSVQTVLRQFGSRAGLIEANIEYALGQVAEERATPVGDVDAAVRVICEHYESRADIALLMLAQEKSDAQVGVLTVRGRLMHRQWVADVFAPFAGGDDAIVDLLVVATDVYTWKLLRRDLGLSGPQTRERIHTLVTAVLTATTDWKDN
jgi:AcrR family transcriptional regulator